MRFLTDMQGNTMARFTIWHHARKIALDDILAHGCKRDELGNYCAKNGPLNGLWYKATMETFQLLIERLRQQCWTEAILSQASPSIQCQRLESLPAQARVLFLVNVARAMAHGTSNAQCCTAS